MGTSVRVSFEPKNGMHQSYCKGRLLVQPHGIDLQARRLKECVDSLLHVRIKGLLCLLICDPVIGVEIMSHDPSSWFDLCRRQQHVLHQPIVASIPIQVNSIKAAVLQRSQGMQRIVAVDVDLRAAGKSVLQHLKCLIPWQFDNSAPVCIGSGPLPFEPVDQVQFFRLRLEKDLRKVAREAPNFSNDHLWPEQSGHHRVSGCISFGQPWLNKRGEVRTHLVILHRCGGAKGRAPVQQDLAGV
mmetsp:Transcript_17739/g.30760  ORF Transcript_17739/g.30760 Transcript_17739/m.30760 type:complete len:242 (-) Transcript_17739:1058-1783(-)